MPEERARQDSSRDLLEELEDGWATPSAGKVAASDSPSSPNVAEIDEGWLDQLFPEDDEPDEEEEESEPELPDERLDPVAFAAAKKAQAERIAAKKERKKQKLEAKRTRQREKAAAMRQKQKGKAKRKGPAPIPRRASSKPPKSVAPKVSDEEREESAADAAEEIAEVLPPKPSKAKKTSVAVAKKQAPNTIASIKLLAIVLAALIALAATVAVLAK